MLLRPRQKTFSERSVECLNTYGNTLGVAPTGAGKTILFSHIVGQMLKSQSVEKVLVLAHRDELTFQNRDKFLRVNPGVETSVMDSRNKSWDGSVTFAMVQTLSNASNIKTIPHIDLLVIDEAHHAVADTYLRIVQQCLTVNPKCKILGLTATPNRGDGHGLRDVFSNVSDQISLGELISSGHLVKPRTFVIDVNGVSQALSKVKKSGQDFDMAAVDKIMNQEPINEAVVAQWKEKAADRKTVVFCSTVAHAEAVCKSFNDQGVNAVMINGQMSNDERNKNLASYSSGDAQVIVNVQVLTEGWDHPPTSCVILLRPSSAKSTMIQMVGRGLRTVDAVEYPKVIKEDCMILDFGTSSIIHGTLEQDINLDGRDLGDPLTMACPSCEAQIPLASFQCPICGFELRNGSEGEAKTIVSSVEMMEINLLNKSSFQWVNLFDDKSAFISTGFNAWAGVFFFGDTWYSVGGRQNEKPKLLTIGPKIVCLATSDDWLNENETEDTAYKSRKWLGEQPTEKQISVLPNEKKLDFNLTRYQASAWITFLSNKQSITELITK